MERYEDYYIIKAYNQLTEKNKRKVDDLIRALLDSQLPTYAPSRTKRGRYQY